MPTRDLRDWIDQVDALGELTRVDGADPVAELGGITDLYQWDMGNPALLFDRIVGYAPGYRVLSNVLTSLRRIALSLNLPVESTPRELVQAWRQQLVELTPRPAELVDDGALFQNQQDGADVDLTRFPAPIWHADDGGRYI